jgi:hypothetical protein
MHQSSKPKRTMPLLLAAALFVVALSACSPTSPTNIIRTPTPTPEPFYFLSGGGSCVNFGYHPQPPYMNIRVSHDTYLAHSESMLAEDPQNPLHLVGGSKFFTGLAHYRFKIGYYASFDGGCTWTDGDVLLGFEDSIRTSDPSFAFGPDNEVYAGVLYETNTGYSGIAVSASTDGGETFGSPVTVFETKERQIFNDKPWITVDQTQGRLRGTIYVVWSYDHNNRCRSGGNCEQNLGFSRSTDGGKTFSQVRLVEGNAPFCTNVVPGFPAHTTQCDGVLGATPVVEPDGALAVAFAYDDLTYRSRRTLMVVTTSPDGGATWTLPVLAATIRDVAGRFRHQKYRNVSLPAFACDPQTGQLYLAWSNKGNTDADIQFTTSEDHGRAWSMPIRVNDDPLQDGANQFQPQLAAAPDGVVSVSFFDTRVDPQHLLIDVYLAQSIDHGASFLKNVRVTTQSWDPAVGAPTDLDGHQFIGDYQGLTADDHFVHPFWNDTRTGAQEIFTATLPSIQPDGSQP